MAPRLRFLSLLIVGSLGAALLCGGCAPPSTPAEGAERSPALTDRAYLTAPLWNDGQAEVAFYRVRRSRDAEDRPAEETFLVGTYLVKHRFNTRAMTKAGTATGPEAGADATDAFKYALFYELESGSYEFKRHWVTNARQRDLRPLKAAFSGFDWCSTLYEEFAFPGGEGGENGDTRYLKRSDDYGNAERVFERHAGAFPMQMLPLLVRGLDFSEEEERAFSVVLPSGAHVPARARLAGTDSLALPGGPRAAERIAVTYDRPVPSMVAGQAGGEETYWRGTGPARLLLKLEGDDYEMTLEEELRSPYWQENVWQRLTRVRERP